jgi:GNAT superfamily N-acetyltransferase
MTLELAQIAEQLNAIRDDLRAQATERAQATRRAVAVLASDPTSLVHERVSHAGKRLALPVPAVVAPLTERQRIGGAPNDFAVVAADGSMIEVDRHSPLRCSVINIGWAVLRYGAEPACELKAEASLETRHLSFVDPDDHSVRRIDGQLLGIQRSIEEFERIAALMERLPPELPAVALVDNPLTVWGLADPRVKGFIRARPASGGPSLLERYTEALARVERACQHRQAGLVGYVSSPSLEFVANLLRVAVCPHPVADCRRYCPSSNPDDRDCRSVETSDAALFFAYLCPGERSALFHAQRASGDDAGPDIWFCYLHTGEEIARIELPAWVATNPERLELTLAVVLDQVERGHGYPVALTEAHECAVIRADERDMFQRLVLECLAATGLPEAGTAKARSKRVRGV